MCGDEESLFTLIDGVPADGWTVRGGIREGVSRLSNRCEDRGCNYRHQNRFVLHVESLLRVELSDGPSFERRRWYARAL